MGTKCPNIWVHEAIVIQTSLSWRLISNEVGPCAEFILCLFSLVYYYTQRKQVICFKIAISWNTVKLYFTKCIVHCYKLEYFLRRSIEISKHVWLNPLPDVLTFSACTGKRIFSSISVYVTAVISFWSWLQSPKRNNSKRKEVFAAVVHSSKVWVHIWLTP